MGQPLSFKKELIAKIRFGIKTMTRRPIKFGLDGEVFFWHKEEKAVLQGKMNKKRKKWAVGEALTIKPGRSERGVGQILVTDIRQEKLGDISEADAQAEGFASREEFFSYFEALYKKKPDLNAMMWVISFTYIDKPYTSPSARYAD